MVRLATPVAVAELGWTTMGTVDTLMVGRLSAEAIGAVALGTRRTSVTPNHERSSFLTNNGASFAAANST